MKKFDNLRIINKSKIFLKILKLKKLRNDFNNLKIYKSRSF